MRFDVAPLEAVAPQHQHLQRIPHFVGQRPHKVVARFGPSQAELLLDSCAEAKSQPSARQLRSNLLRHSVTSTLDQLFELLVARGYPRLLCGKVKFSIARTFPEAEAHSPQSDAAARNQEFVKRAQFWFDPKLQRKTAVYFVAFLRFVPLTDHRPDGLSPLLTQRHAPQMNEHPWLRIAGLCERQHALLSYLLL